MNKHLSSSVLGIYLAVGALTPVLSAEVHRCTNSSGETVFQDMPCKGSAPRNADAGGGSRSSNTPMPASPNDREFIQLSEQTRLLAHPGPGLKEPPPPDAAPDPRANADADLKALTEKLKRESEALQLQRARQAQQVQQATNAASKSKPAPQNDKAAQDAERAKRFQPQLPYGLWPWLPASLFMLGVLGYVLPFLRSSMRDMLDGQDRNDPEARLSEPLATIVSILHLQQWFVNYRGPWWRSAALGSSWILLWYAVLSRTDLFITLFWCSFALPLIFWSVYRGARYRFGLLGEYDYYERQDFPELYGDDADSPYEIPEDAPQRLNEQIVVCAGLAFISGIAAWWLAGGSFISNVLFIIFGGVAAVATVMLLGAVLLRVYLLIRLNDH
ncbi:hypothetical protein [Parachitinimonas caeni]|uniref:DUF4124 domain-containing protein n=1 Tax=Parachitinimonas caeni TaxID=3031301 RepID=A0ABT7DZ58_9NEIS|nr:hypothetical protein [Parachitinimonas caeni]MDK2125342.1 hypothetical protein [Parachitinimonas caeni]